MSDRNGDGRIVVVCVGDSNTDDSQSPPDHKMWCTRFARPRKWLVINVARARAGAEPAASFNGPAQLHRGLAARPDAVAIALGTNDIQVGRTVAQVIGYIDALAKDVSAAGAVPWVATIPPRYGGIFVPVHETIRQEVNAALRREFPRTLLEFDTGFDRHDLLPDGVHLTDAAQEKRATVAAIAMGAAAGKQE